MTPAVVAMIVLVSSVEAPVDSGFTVEQAVAVALQRNRDAIAARLDIEASELDVVAARIYPNPVVQYGIGNLVVGQANPQGGALASSPGFAGQRVQSIGVSELLDVWMKRSARARAAEQGVVQRRLLTEDALREVVYAVRSGFTDVLRAQGARKLAREVVERFGEVVRLARARFKAGDIAQTELGKLELEGLRYVNAVTEADAELDLARGKLAALLGVAPGEMPAGELAQTAIDAPATDASLAALTARALQQRPDLRAAGAARTRADAELSAARREVYPDLIVGAAYTHSDFEVSGDNPNTLAFSLSLPLPLFDRNQANIGRARLEARRADNDGERLRLEVARDVAAAVRLRERARALLAALEAPGDGMLRAPRAR
jgi:cobalt-zinc-cadmium efflux system outer membrane protein